MGEVIHVNFRPKKRTNLVELMKTAVEAAKPIEIPVPEEKPMEDKPIHNYTPTATEGSKYREYRSADIKDIAKMIRRDLKKKYPKCKFSVTIERYAGGQSMTIRLMEGPFEAILKTGMPHVDTYFEPGDTEFDGGYIQINHYSFREKYDETRPMPGWTNGCKLSREAWDCLKYAADNASAYNYNDSDSMIDYFNVNFYLHLSIGKWDKPFKNTRKGE